MLVIDERGKSFLVETGSRLETDIGIFEIPPEPDPPTVLNSHLDHSALMVRPGIRDYIESMSRPTRILHFEDIGYIIARTGVRPGDTVIEAGTGSGATTLYFSAAVGAEGEVITYERRADIFEVANENIAGFGGLDNVSSRNRDIAEAGDEIANLVFLDLADPSSQIERMAGSILRGGFLVAYAPFIEEAKRCFSALSELRFMDREMCEISRCEYEIRHAGTRPRSTQTVHTGYIVMGRRGTL